MGGGRVLGGRGVGGGGERVGLRGGGKGWWGQSGCENFKKKKKLSRGGGGLGVRVDVNEVCE